jgi:hypothetical protein
VDGGRHLRCRHRRARGCDERRALPARLHDR